MKIGSVGTELFHADKQRTMMQLVVAFTVLERPLKLCDCSYIASHLSISLNPTDYHKRNDFDWKRSDTRSEENCKMC